MRSETGNNHIYILSRQFGFYQFGISNQQIFSIKTNPSHLGTKSGLILSRNCNLSVVQALPFLLSVNTNFGKIHDQTNVQREKSVSSKALPNSPGRLFYADLKSDETIPSNKTERGIFKSDPSSGIKLALNMLKKRLELPPSAWCFAQSFTKEINRIHRGLHSWLTSFEAKI